MEPWASRIGHLSCSLKSIASLFLKFKSKSGLWSVGENEIECLKSRESRQTGGNKRKTSWRLFYLNALFNFFFSFDLKKNYWIFANRRLDPIQFHKAKDRKGNYLYVNNATWASWMVMGCFNFHEMYSWIDWLTQLMIMPSCETCLLSYG